MGRKEHFAPPSQAWVMEEDRGEQDGRTFASSRGRRKETQNLGRDMNGLMSAQVGQYCTLYVCAEDGAGLEAGREQRV